MINRNKLKTIRHIAWAVIAVLLGVFVFGRMAHNPSDTVTLDLSKTSHPFAMKTHKDVAVTDKDFAGKPSMIFFGFTNCPAICPGALADMTLWLEKLGGDAEKVHALFVSLDPQRDDVKRLHDYLKSYDNRIVGLTGTDEQAAAIAKTYGVFYKKMPAMDDGNYMVDHSASVYLYSANGALVSTIDASENRDIAFAKIKKLIGG